MSRTLLVSVPACVVVLFAGSSAYAACEVKGVIKDVRGEGAYITRYGQNYPLVPGTRVCAGDTLYAGHRGAFAYTINGYSGVVPADRSKSVNESEAEADSALSSDGDDDGRPQD